MITELRRPKRFILATLGATESVGVTCPLGERWHVTDVVASLNWVGPSSFITLGLNGHVVFTIAITNVSAGATGFLYEAVGFVDPGIIAYPGDILTATCEGENLAVFANSTLIVVGYTYGFAGLVDPGG